MNLQKEALAKKTKRYNPTPRARGISIIPPHPSPRCLSLPSPLPPQTIQSDAPYTGYQLITRLLVLEILLTFVTRDRQNRFEIDGFLHIYLINFIFKNIVPQFKRVHLYCGTANGQVMDSQTVTGKVTWIYFHPILHVLVHFFRFCK